MSFRPRKEVVQRFTSEDYVMRHPDKSGLSKRPPGYIRVHRRYNSEDLQPLVSWRFIRL